MEDCSGAALFAAHDRMRETFERTGSVAAALAAELARYDDQTCPMCGASNAPLGSLGSRVHYSCRACGMSFSHERT